METRTLTSMLIIPVEEWNAVQLAIKRIEEKLEALRVNQPPSLVPKSPYITAKEFMAAVRICRSNFDKLVQKGIIMTIKRGRKVYVVASEVERYFVTK